MNPYLPHTYPLHTYPPHPAPRPATPLRTILLIGAGIVLFVLVLASALAGGGEGSSDGSSTGPECRTEFFDGGSISSCDGELVSTDVGADY